jgi:hypothetical protein
LFGSTHWRFASTILVAVCVGSAAGAIWHFAVFPQFNAEPEPQSETAAPWIPGDPVPALDNFPVSVQVDRRPMTMFNAPDTRPPLNGANLYAVVHGIALTNTSTERIFAYLQLILPWENGRFRAADAEIDNLPTQRVGRTPGTVEPLEQPFVGGAQLQRVVTLEPRSVVLGFAGFKLTERVLEGRFGTSAPYRMLSSLSREEMTQHAHMALNAALRVTNQLDGSYRDFPLLQVTEGKAKQFERAQEGGGIPSVQGQVQ